MQKWVRKSYVDLSHVWYCPPILYSRVMRNLEVLHIGKLHADAQTRIALQMKSEERWRRKHRGFYEEWPMKRSAAVCVNLRPSAPATPHRDFVFSTAQYGGAFTFRKKVVTWREKPSLAPPVDVRGCAPSHVARRADGPLR